MPSTRVITQIVKLSGIATTKPIMVQALAKATSQSAR